MKHYKIHIAGKKHKSDIFLLARKQPIFFTYFTTHISKYLCVEL
jgi:hypothetical protein